MKRSFDIISNKQTTQGDFSHSFSHKKEDFSPTQMFSFSKTSLIQFESRNSLSSRFFHIQKTTREVFGRVWNKYVVLRYRVRVFCRHTSSQHRVFSHPISPFRILLKPARLSLFLAVLVGMGATHFIESSLSTPVSADREPVVSGAVQEKEFSPEDVESLLKKGFDESALAQEKPFELKMLSEFIEEGKQEKFEDEVRRLVKGYPIEEMLPYILEKDRITATFLIGIGKKESNWGRRVPVLDGQDCYNYWGFREKRRLMGTGGHTCFNSRKDAIDSVAYRIEKLIFEYERDTPKEMIVWKCGYSCAGHSPESVRKWISDVEGYYTKLNEVGEEN